MNEMRLYDIQGYRLYLSADERSAFLAAARKHPRDISVLTPDVSSDGSTQILAR